MVTVKDEQILKICRTNTMLHTRKVKTASGKTAIQVICYVNRERKILKHIGSGDNSSEISQLFKQAQLYIEKITHQKKLNTSIYNSNRIDDYEYLRITHSFSYEILCQLYKRLGFTILKNDILKNLVVMRIFEPTSKLQSISLLQKYFNVYYKKSFVFQKQKEWYIFKENIEDIALKFASERYGFAFNVIFYDITTLYFEAFKEDELRKCGFSKDNKFNQPQILVALIVTDNGFPIGYEVIEGNKFEGHTLLPFILKFRNQHNTPKLTVVADSAMISKENIDELIENKLCYIVGARLGNLPLDLIEKISKRLGKIDKATFRAQTKLGTLICQFVKTRYAKDKQDMAKQIRQAKQKIQNSKNSLRLRKFIKKIGRIKYELNKKLQEKTELLLGIKGYYTNLKGKPNTYVINQYRHLWKVEKAFRIAKSDLMIRPIYHYKEKSIQSHVLMCFMALCISKHIELETGISIHKFLKSIKSITEAVLRNKLSQKTVVMRMKIPDSVASLLKKLALPH